MQCFGQDYVPLSYLDRLQKANSVDFDSTLADNDVDDVGVFCCSDLRDLSDELAVARGRIASLERQLAASAMPDMTRRHVRLIKGLFQRSHYSYISCSNALSAALSVLRSRKTLHDILKSVFLVYICRRNPPIHEKETVL